MLVVLKGGIFGLRHCNSVDNYILRKIIGYH
jgi:hypothetical protein